MGLRELQDCVEKCGALSPKPFAYASPYGRKMWLQKKINIYVCMGDIHFWNYYNFLGFCNGKRLSRFWQSHNSKYDAIHVRIGTKYTTTVTQWKWRWLRARMYIHVYGCIAIQNNDDNVDSWQNEWHTGSQATKRNMKMTMTLKYLYRNINLFLSSHKRERKTEEKTFPISACIVVWCAAILSWAELLFFFSTGKRFGAIWMLHICHGSSKPPYAEFILFKWFRWNKHVSSHSTCVYVCCFRTTRRMPLMLLLLLLLSL